MLQNLPGGLQSLPSVLLWGQHVSQPSKPLGPQGPQTQGKPSSLYDRVGQSLPWGPWPDWDAHPWNNSPSFSRCASPSSTPSGACSSPHAHMSRIRAL